MLWQTFFEIDVVACEGECGTNHTHDECENFGDYSAPTAHMYGMEQAHHFAAWQQMQTERHSCEGKHHQPQHHPISERGVQVEPQLAPPFAGGDSESLPPLLSVFWPHYPHAAQQYDDEEYRNVNQRDGSFGLYMPKANQKNRPFGLQLKLKFLSSMKTEKTPISWFLIQNPRMMESMV